MPNLLCCSFNMHGNGKNKIPALKNFLSRHKIDIIGLSETHLTEFRNFGIDGYKEHRHDITSRNRGVALLVKSNIPHQKINSPIINELIETVRIMLYDGTVVVSMYKNPKYTFHSTDLNKIFDLGDQVVIFGDLSSCHGFWNCHTSNSSGQVLYRYIQCNVSNIQVHYSKEPTHYPTNGGTPTTIDLVLTKGNTFKFSLHLGI